MSCECQTKRNRKCTRKASYFGCCKQHASIKWNSQVALIQAYWRGGKTRRLVRVIFAQLPRDIQRHILFYIREPLLLEKHHYTPIRRVIRGYMRNMCIYLTQLEPDAPTAFAFILRVMHLINKYGVILQGFRHRFRLLYIV